MPMAQLSTSHMGNQGRCSSADWGECGMLVWWPGYINISVNVTGHSDAHIRNKSQSKNSHKWVVELTFMLLQKYWYTRLNYI